VHTDAQAARAIRCQHPSPHGGGVEFAATGVDDAGGRGAGQRDARRAGRGRLGGNHARFRTWASTYTVGPHSSGLGQAMVADSDAATISPWRLCGGEICQHDCAVLCGVLFPQFHVDSNALVPTERISVHSHPYTVQQRDRWSALFQPLADLPRSRSLRKLPVLVATMQHIPRCR
jgi:hypothetical protein